MTAHIKTALVTGANRGLGLETCRQLAKLGHEVYLGARDLDKGLKAASELEKEGLKVFPIELDVTKSASIKSAVNIIQERSAGLDVLVNNAGVMLDTGEGSNKAMNVDPVIVLKTMEVNLTGPLKVTQAFAKLMKNRGARIINISSGMGSLNEMDEGWAAYRASKAALNALTIVLSKELKEFDISVNSVCPGWVRTDLGGENAPLSPSEGVKTTIWLATQEGPPSGKFFRDKKEIAW